MGAVVVYGFVTAFTLTKSGRTRVGEYNNDTMGNSG
jgi:hypothetical protein